MLDVVNLATRERKKIPSLNKIEVEHNMQVFYCVAGRINITIMDFIYLLIFSKPSSKIHHNTTKMPQIDDITKNNDTLLTLCTLDFSYVVLYTSARLF